MHQPERKYQLFPRENKQLSAAPGKTLDPEQAFALAMGQQQNADKNASAEKGGVGNALRLRMKEHNLTRRRKVSVPELGPMTTVQEVAMDSRMSAFFFLSRCRVPDAISGVCWSGASALGVC
jgi:hypothetical protein